MAKKFIPLNAIVKLMDSCDVKRSSLKAKLELKRYLEEQMFDIAESSIKLAKHANRKTVLDSDVRLVLSHLSDSEK